MTELDLWKKRAEFLYRLLDNISTINDMAKDNDRAYRNMASTHAERRSLIANSPDGQNLVWLSDAESKAAMDLACGTVNGVPWGHA